MDNTIYLLPLDNLGRQKRGLMLIPEGIPIVDDRAGANQKTIITRLDINIRRAKNVETSTILRGKIDVICTKVCIFANFTCQKAPRRYIPRATASNRSGYYHE